MIKGAKEGTPVALGDATGVRPSGGLLQALFGGGGQKAVTRETPDEDYSFFRDLFDGGGMGRSGSQFAGPFGGLLNAIGIRPMGYTEPQKPTAAMLAAKRAAVRPSTTPMGRPNVAPAAAAGVLPTAAYEPLGLNRPMQGPYMQPVLPSVPPVAGPYPLTDFGNLLMRLQTQGIPQMPSYRRVGPQ